MPSIRFMITMALIGIFLLTFLVSWRAVTKKESGYASIFKGGVNVDVSNLKYDKMDLFLKSNEFSLCAHKIIYAYERNYYGYGVFYWNRFVWDYIPGQIIGRDLKASLGLCKDVYNPNDLPYAAYLGCTSLGFADTFQSFSFLGCFFWGVISYWMRIFYQKAMMRKSLSIFLYMALVVPSMETITHQSAQFTNYLTFLILVVLPLSVLSVRIFRANRYS